MQRFIYVLKLQDGCWYVGKTTDVEARFLQHMSGSASSWTNAHQPIQIFSEEQQVKATDEQSTTVDYILKYGPDKVRGGKFVRLKLDQQEAEEIVRTVWSIQERCVKCGSKAHFARDCQETEHRKKQLVKWIQQGHGFTDFQYVPYVQPIPVPQPFQYFQPLVANPPFIQNPPVLPFVRARSRSRGRPPLANRINPGAIGFGETVCRICWRNSHCTWQCFAHARLDGTPIPRCVCRRCGKFGHTHYHCPGMGQDGAHP